MQSFQTTLNSAVNVAQDKLDPNRAGAMYVGCSQTHVKRESNVKLFVRTLKFSVELSNEPMSVFIVLHSPCAGGCQVIVTTTVFLTTVVSGLGLSL